MDYLERQDGPDGQFCELLTRIPYDVERKIEIGLRDARTNLDRMDVALRALLWECSVKDTLTGEMTNLIDRAGAEVVQPWRVRAIELYNAWYAQAMPGPKGSSRTASQTPTSTPTSSTSATSAAS